MNNRLLGKLLPLWKQACSSDLMGYVLSGLFGLLLSIAGIAFFIWYALQIE